MDDTTPRPPSGGDRLRDLVAELQLTPTHVTVLLVAASCACAGLVALWWVARPAPVAAPELTSAAIASAPAPTPSPSPAPVVVHVSGAVTAAGVVELPAGARVLDAVEAAGGLRRRARTEQLNLARVVRDGEQIHVPDGRTTAGVPTASGRAPDAGAGLASAPGAVDAGAAPAAGTTGALSLNTASADELETLPGLGPVLAARIIDHREAVGGFTAVDQLLEVSGIGEKTMAALRDLVTV